MLATCVRGKQHWTLDQHHETPISLGFFLFCQMWSFSFYHHIILCLSDPYLLLLHSLHFTSMNFPRFVWHRIRWALKLELVAVRVLQRKGFQATNTHKSPQLWPHEHINGITTPKTSYNILCICVSVYIYNYSIYIDI